VEGEPGSVRAFVSLPTDRESGGGYRLTSEVISNESQKEELLRDIQLTIARWSQKLHLLDQDIAELLEEVDNRINSKTTQPQQAAA
jgi:Mg2+ and Co2+ transporter CorA